MISISTHINISRKHLGVDFLLADWVDPCSINIHRNAIKNHARFNPKERPWPTQFIFSVLITKCWFAEVWLKCFMIALTLETLRLLFPLTLNVLQMTLKNTFWTSIIQVRTIQSQKIPKFKSLLNKVYTVMAIYNTVEHGFMIIECDFWIYSPLIVCLIYFRCLQLQQQAQ